jgi:hypothetical protein
MASRSSGAKSGCFSVVNRDRDDDLVKQRAGPFDDIEMTIRHRIKAARINRAPHDSERFNELGLPFNSRKDRQD